MKTCIILFLFYTVHAHHRHGHVGDSEENVIQILENVPHPKQTEIIQEIQTPSVKVQQSENPSKVTIQIPANVQQVVTQVSQQVPVFVNLAQIRLASSPPLGRVQSFVTQAEYNINNNHAEEASNKKCDFKCTRYDTPVCGYNGHCYREFESQCTMSKYNCLHTQKTFRTVEEDLCQATTTTKCYQGDF